MSVKRQRSIGSTVALPLLALGLPLVATLTGCGSNSASSPASQSSLTTVATSAATAGSDGSTAPSTTATTTSTATTTATTTATVTTSASSNGTHATDPSSIANSHAAGSGSSINVRDLDYVAFASPSGHIQCSYVIDGGGEVSCQVEGAQWTPKSTSSDCQQAQGDEASLPGTGPGELACHTSTEMGSAIIGSEKTSWTSRHTGTTGTWNGRTVAVLPYGTTMLLGNLLSCTSHPSGMTCSNEAGHSFTVARGGYSVK